MACAINLAFLFGWWLCSDMSRIMVSNKAAIDEAARILQAGGLVGLPTETVYGLAANALDGQAVAKIYVAKGRPSFNPLIIHCHSFDQAAELVEMNADARAVAEVFWPGPLTLILPRKAGCKVSDLAGAGLPTLAVRVPKHDAALAVLRACGVPLAAPSANKSGALSATTPQHVAEAFGDEVALVLAAGPCKVGLESTVLDLSGGAPVVLRPGGITAEEISEVLGRPVGYDYGDHDTPKSPGQLLKHYAPSIPVRVNAIDLERGEALLAFGSIKFMGIRGGGAAKDLPEDSLKNLSESGDLYEAAANLFSMMRALDRAEHKGIAVMNIPETGLGVAINDRLRRAARGGGT